MLSKVRAGYYPMLSTQNLSVENLAPIPKTQDVLAVKLLKSSYNVSRHGKRTFKEHSKKNLHKLQYNWRQTLALSKYQWWHVRVWIMSSASSNKCEQL